MTAIVSDRRLRPPEEVGLEIEVIPGPQPGTVQVVARGEIDFHNATFLRQVLLAAVVSHRATILLDLQGVAFCDCAGLNTLLAARRAALRAGRGLHITAAGRRVERLLDLTDTRSLLT
ncbi:STAS domain-containing protein [Streptomyces erythrochromogenes]|uniref:STAS domain-containing protein n=1 Tax=Streptomyces erythrochromogenes TaxID=285574 RepID=UPI00068CFA77|nr:STAS domain-containing protein [Streptomyces erythrochromogenes]